MNLPWKIVKKTYTPADKKIEEIINLLFPPLILEQEIDKDGGVTKFHIDYSADSNLDSVLSDLEDGHNDKACHDTLKDISNRLFKLRKMLEAYRELDKDARYIIVENFNSNNEEIGYDEGQYWFRIG